jgi:hypothetical protein
MRRVRKSHVLAVAAPVVRAAVPVVAVDGVRMAPVAVVRAVAAATVTD